MELVNEVLVMRAEEIYEAREAEAGKRADGPRKERKQWVRRWRQSVGCWRGRREESKEILLFLRIDPGN